VRAPDHDSLRLRRLGIDTYTDPVVFMNRECTIFRSEGFEARARVKVTLRERLALRRSSVSLWRRH